MLPTLLVVGLLSFWTLSADPVARAAGHVGPHELPLFFNPAPWDVAILARQAMDRVAVGGSESRIAQQELVRLGGAALPHVIPRLPQLSQEARGRVAVALAPLAARMGIGSSQALDTPDSALIFWTNFWEDHGIDFRPIVAERAVTRVGERATASRREDVMKLDTFALKALIESLGAVESAEDVERVRRLNWIASHVTGIEWPVSAASPQAQSEEQVRAWRRWWTQHHAEFVSFDEPQHLVAEITETRFGAWILDILRGDLGSTAAGDPVAAVLKARAPLTLRLLAWTLLGGFLFGMIGSLGSGRFPPGSRADRAVAVLLALVVALPTAFLGGWLAGGPGPLNKESGAIGLLVLSAAALVSRYQRLSLRGELDAEHNLTARALGASPLRIAVRGLRQSGVVGLSWVGVELPSILSGVLISEQAFGLQGLAEPTLVAIGEHDVAWLMTLSLSSLLLVAFIRLACDSLLIRLNPLLAASLVPSAGEDR